MWKQYKQYKTGRLERASYSWQWVRRNLWLLQHGSMGFQEFLFQVCQTSEYFGLCLLTAEATYMFVSKLVWGSNGAGMSIIMMFGKCSLNWLLSFLAPMAPTTWRQSHWAKLWSKLWPISLLQVTLWYPWKRSVDILRQTERKTLLCHFSFQLQTSGDPTEPPSYEKAVAS